MLEKYARQTQGFTKKKSVQAHFNGNLGSDKMKDVMIWVFLLQHTIYSTVNMWFQTRQGELQGWNPWQFCQSTTVWNVKQKKIMSTLLKRQGACKDQYISFLSINLTAQHQCSVYTTQASRSDQTDSIPKTPLLICCPVLNLQLLSQLKKRSTVLKPIR